MFVKGTYLVSGRLLQLFDEKVFFMKCSLLPRRKIKKRKQLNVINEIYKLKWVTKNAIYFTVTMLLLQCQKHVVETRYIVYSSWMSGANKTHVSFASIHLLFKSTTWHTVKKAQTTKWNTMNFVFWFYAKSWNICPHHHYSPTHTHIEKSCKINVNAISYGRCYNFVTACCGVCWYSFPNFHPNAAFTI